jgi:pyruvate/2-oxoglutarate dehydrogenase complex dihydrolipoamide acyltransferase (E2) component
MAVEVTIPKLGLTMQEATVVRWLKAPGEAVKCGEPLLEIETEKITCEVESPADGTLSEIVVGEGTVAPVAAVIGLIEPS